jgi:rare lipoprotein A
MSKLSNASKIRATIYIVISLTFVILGGCQQGGGGRNIIPTPDKDGAPARLLSPEEAARIPDAVPKVELRTKAGNKSPYTVLGKTYRLLPDTDGYKARGFASWYGTKFHGQKTSNGEEYDLYQMTAAHKTLPIPCYVRVTNLENGRQVVVRVNDRGPFHEGRIIDLSYAAAAKLGFGGTARVEVEAIDPLTFNAKKSPPPITIPPAIPFPAQAKVDDLIAEAEQEVVETTATTQTVVQQSNTSAASTDSQKVYLQLGAFTNMNSAQALKLRASQLLKTNVVISTNPSNNANRVRVGPISADQIEVVEAAIRKAQLGDSIVVME